MAIEKASREQLWLRMAIQGPSGSGKTATGLITAHGLTKHYGGKIGVIDTQNRQSLDYVGTRFAPNGFDVFHLANGNPDSLRNAIKQFVAAGGYSVVFIDSLSVTWAGEGGLLDISAESDRKESFSKWNDLNKTQNKMLGDIMRSPFHVIASIQSKTDWLMETEVVDGKKKTSITKVGLAPVQKKGIEYFWSLYVTMDLNHNMTIERINAFEELDRAIIHKPDETWVDPLVGWLKKGEGKLGEIELHGRKATVEQLEEYYAIHLKHGRGDRRLIDAAFFTKYGSKPEDCELEFFEERLEDLRSVRVVPRPKVPTTKEVLENEKKDHASAMAEVAKAETSEK